MTVIGGHPKDAGVLGCALVDATRDRTSLGFHSRQSAMEAVRHEVVISIMEHIERAEGPFSVTFSNQVGVVLNNVFVDRDPALRSGIDSEKIRAFPIVLAILGFP